MTTLTPRLQIAAMCLQGLLHDSGAYDCTKPQLAQEAVKHADALLAECGEGEAAQSRKVEWSLSASLLKQLVDVINHTNDRDMVDRITESVAFKAAAKYINGADQ